MPWLITPVAQVVDQAVGLGGVARQHGDQAADGQDHDRAQHDQHAEDREQQSHQGDALGHLLVAQPGVQRMDQQHDHQRQEHRSDQPGELAGAEHHDGAGRQSEQDRQSPRQRVGRDDRRVQISHGSRAS
jgi:hypothetical protein